MSDPKIQPVQRPLVRPSGREVWTDEFDPNGETLPEAVIQMRRARRAYQQPPEPPLELPTLDLSQPRPPAPQRMTPKRGIDAGPGEDFQKTAALVQLLRSQLS